MNVVNIHQVEFTADPAKVGGLLDSLASVEDRLWPKHVWPPLQLDRPLAIGANGGHGPIQYFVEKYRPGRLVKFRFTSPKGFIGYHQFEAAPFAKRGFYIKHTLRMQTQGIANISWPLIYRPLHDALIEDALATAQVSLGDIPTLSPWSLWVKVLRYILSGGRAKKQKIASDV